MKSSATGRTLLLLMIPWASAVPVLGAPGDGLWALSLEAELIGAPALGINGDVIVGSNDGTVRAVAPDGWVRWTFKAADRAICSPAVGSEGTIYFGGDRLHALAPEGGVIWELGWPGEPVSPEVRYLSSPAIGPDGAIYLVQFSPVPAQGGLICVNPDGTLRWRLAGAFRGEPVVGWQGAVFVPGNDGLLRGINPDSVVLWEQEEFFIHLPHAAPALTSNGTLVIPWVDPNLPVGGIRTYSAEGALGWLHTTEAWPMGSPSIGPDGIIYCAFASGQVAALAGDGQLQWEYQVEPAPDIDSMYTTPAVASDGTVYVTAARWLHALDREGRLLWRYDAGAAGLGSPLIGSDGAVYFRAPGHLVAVEGNGSALADGQWPMFRGSAQHRAGLAITPDKPDAPTTVSATLGDHTDQVL